MRSILALGFSVAIAWTATSCAERVSDGNDSESHFVCADDTECETRLGSGYACLAGECRIAMAMTNMPETGADVVVPNGEDDAAFLPPAPSFDASDECFEIRTTSERIGIDLYILLDTSQAMADDVPLSTSSFWDQTRSGIGMFLAESGAAATGIGLQYFPLDGVAPASCEAPYSTVEVPLGLVSELGAAIEQSLAGQVTAGLRPTAPALAGMLQAAALQSQGSFRLPVVALVTRGLPDECSPTDLSEIAALASTAATSTTPVRTAVIALGTDLAELDGVATAGGTDAAFFIESGDVADQLRDALLALARGYNAPPSCSIVLPSLPGAVDPINPDLVNVEIGPDWQRLRYVEQASGCSDTPQAWYYDDSADPTVHLCPAACDRLPAQDARVAFGCPTEH